MNEPGMTTWEEKNGSQGLRKAGVRTGKGRRGRDKRKGLAWGGGRGGRNGVEERSGKKGQEGGPGGAAGLGSFLRKTGDKRSLGGAGSGYVFFQRAMDEDALASAPPPAPTSSKSNKKRALLCAHCHLLLTSPPGKSHSIQPSDSFSTAPRPPKPYTHPASRSSPPGSFSSQYNKKRALPSGRC